MRRSVAGIAIFAMVLTVLVACAPAPQRVTASVGADGFSVALGGVTATAAAGVASERAPRSSWSSWGIRLAGTSLRASSFGGVSFSDVG